MTIDTIKAYRLNPGGSPARLALLRRMATESQNNRNESTRLAPNDWKGARRYTLNGYHSAYATLNQGGNDKTPVWYSHNGPEFRGERRVIKIRPRLPLGYYTDIDCDETAIGIVSRLTHGRFIAGYLWTLNGERVYFPEVFTDEDDAARAANSHAETFAESAREDSERFNAMQDAEQEAEDKLTELQKRIALRHKPQFGGFEAVRDAISELRQARETLADATRIYERG
jgi:hypothetical protein